MVLRDILGKHSLPVDFCVLYIGVIHNWLTPAEVISVIENHLLKKLSEKEIIDLYFVESKQDAILFLRQKLHSSKIDDCSHTLKIWWKAYLLEIISTNSSTDEKIELVANYWSYFNYPEEWKEFINYMPQKQVFGKDNLYHKILEFIENL